MVRLLDAERTRMEGHRDGAGHPTSLAYEAFDECAAILADATDRLRDVVEEATR